MNNLIAGPGRSHQEWGNERAFAAIRSNGRVVTWGDAEYGGDSSAVANQLTRVTQIFSTGGAFAALRQNGSVVTWGNSNSGGNSSAVANQLTGVTQIFSTRYAFAALKQNGTVVTWGQFNSGGNSSDVAGQLTNVTRIFSTEEGFAALKGDRTVVAWGNAQYGGDTSNLANPLTGVTQIFSTRYAFAALKENGSVVTWGNAQYGGDSLDVAGQTTTGVTQIFATEGAFAALKQNGSVVTWGDINYGGFSTPVAGQLTDVQEIFATERAFAARKGNGTVVTWGDAQYGGNSSNVASQLTNVSKIFATGSAFAALKGDGSVVTWGDTQYGGNSSAVASQLTNVSKIFATDRAFAALKGDGSVVTWGDTQYGGDSSAVASQLRSAVEEIATPYSNDAVPTPFKPIIIDIGGVDSTVSGVTGDNRVVGIAVDPGTGNVIIRFGNEELGTAPVDENGNFTYSLTEDNINTIGQGTGKTITATQSNLGNNISGASAPFTFGVDTIAPTVAITDNVPNFANIATDSILYTFTFSEPVTGFTTGDITVTNGSKGTFTPVSPTQYTLVVTPNANVEGDLTVAVAAGSAIDAPGNPSIPQLSVQQVDNIAPTVAITDNVPNVANIATGSITYTLTFREAVTGFTTEDITVTNGSKGTFTPVSPTQYTLVVTPNPNFEGDLTLAVPAGAAIDVASNPSLAPQASVQRVDTKAPTVAITDNVPNTANIATGSILYTFTFSEPVTEFTAGDITVTNGSKGTFTSVSPTQYTLVVTPNANFEGDLTVAVAAGSAIDAAGNPSIPQLSVQQVDTIAPTVAITDNVPNVANIATGSITYTFTFREAVTGFTTEDITVTNGSKGTFTSVSPTQYTLVVTPNANFEGDLTVAVPAGAAIDVASNPSLAPQASVQRVDTIAPTVTITSIGAGDSTVSGVAEDNTVVGTAEAGSGNVTIRFGNTELGTTTVDGNGNFTYSLTAANLTTIGQGTGKTITASQTDPAGNIGTSTPFTFGVDTIAPTVIIRDSNTGTPLQQPFDTVFRFSVRGSTPSSQELQVVFGDDRIQNILTTLGNASGLPSGIDSILNNLQSGLISISQENGNVTRFQLRQVGTRTITPLTIGQVTANGFTLSGGGFNITAEVLGSPDTVIISTQKIEVNGDELEAISLNNLDTSNVTGERITVQVDATLYREAAFDNLVGFYLAERTTGAVVDKLTGERIGLGDRNAYLGAVRNNAVLTGRVANNQTTNLSSSFEVNSSLDLSDYVLLPFLVANSTLNSSDFSNLYVASMGNNSDRSDHVQLLGNNVFGFEDIAGGGDNDFDDVIFQVRGLSVV